MSDPAERALLRLARRAENDQVLLQGGWPASVRVVAAPASADAPLLVYRFAAAFPAVVDAQVRQLALACRLFGDVLRLPPPSALAAQLEAHALFAALFPGDGRIWSVLRAIAARAAWARDEDERYRSGRRALARLVDTDALATARAGIALPRLAAAALALLASDERTGTSCDEGLDAFADGSAALAAVVGWRDDLAAGRATLATARLARAEPDRAAAARAGALDGLAVPFYAGGIAAGVLDVAAAAAARAREVLPPALTDWPDLQTLTDRIARAQDLVASALAAAR